MAYVKKVNKSESDKAITAILQDGIPVVSSPGCDLNCWAAGAEDVDWAAATINDVVATDAASIGGDNGGGSSHDGLIDEFAIWNEALDIRRIESLAAGAPVIHFDNLPGDFNLDGSVTIDDFNIMVANFGQRFHFDVAREKGDINGDLRVNLKDFLGFRQAWNAPAGAATVPEPSSIVLIGLATCWLLGLRRFCNVGPRGRPPKSSTIF